jgi:hypothetical protein
MYMTSDAAGTAAARVAAVHDSTEARFRLAADFYRGSRGRYGRAELRYLRWEIERGVLDRPAARRGGSPWWRAVNDGLLREKVEADLLAAGSPGPPSSRGVNHWLEFIRTPSAAAWYRAHNASILGGYLMHEPLAARELSVERFMMNVALVRVIYAHTLAAAPRTALGRFAPLGRLLGDPRRRSVGVFLDLRNQFPVRYPLTGWRLEDLIAAEGRLARTLDYGLIAPRLIELYAFAAACLGEPRITALVRDGIPCYCWPVDERAPWLGGTTRRPARVLAEVTGRPYGPRV